MSQPFSIFMDLTAGEKSRVTIVHHDAGEWELKDVAALEELHRAIGDVLLKVDCWRIERRDRKAADK